MSPSDTDEAATEDGAPDETAAEPEEAAAEPEEAAVESEEETAAADPLADFANEVAEAVSGTGAVTFGTVKVTVPANRWTDAIRTARDRFGLVFFSWLSATHWSNEVAVGDPPREEVDERYELLCMIGDLSDGRTVLFSTDLDVKDPTADTLTGIFPGADWHEREAHDMFGVVFIGHPNLEPIYLPEGFLGHPLRKTYPLLSRAVKPWPGKVDVEAMPDAEDGDDSDSPSTENPEA